MGTIFLVLYIYIMVRAKFVLITCKEGGAILKLLPELFVYVYVPELFVYVYVLITRKEGGA